MEPTKISVIVPSYNQGPYIENCIKSVLKQSYSNWELIIQDGASTDYTIEICNKYVNTDPRISFFTENDKGFADAVNKGLSRAQGKLAVIQSSDDFFAYQHVFKDAVEIHEKDKNLLLIAGASIIVDENLNLLATQERTTKYVPVENVYILKDHFSQGATFFDLQRALEIGKLDSNLDMVADTDFWIRLICYSPIKLNSIYQTSKIWGGVTVQPNQRSADLSKFYLARARMAVLHFSNEKLDFSPLYKMKHANELISSGIKHFKSIGKDYGCFLTLYKDFNKSDFNFPNESLNFRSILKKIINKSSDKSKAYNSKNELYNNKEDNPSYNFKWFNN